MKFYYETGGTDISIRILNVQSSDAGDYEFQHFPPTPAPALTNSDATVYINGKYI